MKSTRPVILVVTLLMALTSCAVSPVAAPANNVPGKATTQQPAHTVQCEVTDDGFIEKSYEWTYWRFDDRVWKLSTRIPVSLYESYASRPRPQTRNYSVYATEDEDTAIIGDLAHTLAQYAADLALGEQETIQFIATFVQQLTYTSDLETTGLDDYARYPLETLVEEGGDCEDTSILLGKVLTILGYDVVMVRLPAHMAIGVAEGEGFCGTYYPYHDKKYFYLETTGEGGRLGIVPTEYEGQAAYIFPFTPQPAICHQWKGRCERTTYAIHVTVKNEGTADSSGLSILAGFDAGNGKLWNTVESDVFDLSAGEATERDLTLTMPASNHTRVRIFILRDGKSVDKSESAWFDE
ncbi:MAG TPA: hypothetical protein ENL12_04875 [Dehalococcoidia bacterium]|nr:hypothetical protein [Dehalococcoidia bacterium]